MIALRDDLRDQVKHQQWLLDNQRKHAKAALDILRNVLMPMSSEWFQVRASLKNAIALMEFASRDTAPETTAEDVIEGLKIGQAATPPGH